MIRPVTVPSVSPPRSSVMDCAAAGWMANASMVNMVNMAMPAAMVREICHALCFSPLRIPGEEKSRTCETFSPIRGLSGISCDAGRPRVRHRVAKLNRREDWETFRPVAFGLVGIERGIFVMLYFFDD